MPVSLGPTPRYLEELRLGGGYDSLPDGGCDMDRAGNIQGNGDLDMDGGGNFGGDVTVGGDFQVDGVNTDWQVYLPATLGLPDPSLPCGAMSTTNWRNYQVVTASLAFDPTSPEAAFFQCRLPKNYDGRPLKFTLQWSATTGTSGDVRWGVLPIAFTDGSSLTNVGITTYVIDTFDTANYFHSCVIEAAPTTPDELAMMTIRVVRLSNDASDTFGADALLLGVGVSI